MNTAKPRKTWLRPATGEARLVFMDRPCSSYDRAPETREIAELEPAAEPVLRAAIPVMARAGLQVGALPVLTIRGERYTTLSKGKEQAGTIPRPHEAGRCPSDSLMRDSP